jgi:two-component system response regulator TrcR
MSGSAREQRPRQAILGQLARITRADGSPIRVLLVDDGPALTNLVKMALHPDVRAAIDLVRRELSLGT